MYLGFVLSLHSALSGFSFFFIFLPLRLFCISMKRTEVEVSPPPLCKSQIVATPLADACAGFAPAVVGAASDTASPSLVAAL